MDNKKKKSQRWTEWDCPECSANNPWDDGFRIGEEIRCLYCSKSYRVRRKGDDTFRLVDG